MLLKAPKIVTDKLIGKRNRDYAHQVHAALMTGQPIPDGLTLGRSREVVALVSDKIALRVSETIQWHGAGRCQPDDEIDVLLFDARRDKPAWPGYRHGGEWLNADGTVCTPTHWAKLPDGPTRLKEF